jgi:SulP family sulfate permease
VGFTSGIALIIFSSQIKDALGLQISNLPGGFVGKWEVYLHHFSTLNYYAVFITLGTILIALFSRKITTKVPGSFIALILMTVATYSFKLPVSTIETVFGQISGQLSFHLPAADPKMFADYLQPAVTIAILGAIESLLSAVVADGMISGNHRSNTELIAQGIANLVTPLFGGIPATGAIARTAANVKNGGRTPVSGMVHAVTLLLIMLFVAKWAMLIPMSCLAGILLVVAYNMSEWRSFYAILKGSRYDVVVLLTTFLLTVLVDLSVAIEIGIVLSALIFMQRMSKLSNVLPVEMNSDLIENYSGVPAGIDIYEISGPFFFAAARKYQETLRNIESSSRVLILRMRHVPFIDATGIQNLKQTAEYMNNTGVKLVLSGVQDEVRAELEKNRIAFLIGKANIFSNFERALVHAKKITESHPVTAKKVR